MKRILGIDTGTNSLGWAIVEKEDDDYQLLDKGVNIFQEGVKIEKGIEASKAADRTSHRSIRIRYYRIKLRKIRLLRILSDNHLCPPLSTSELSLWRQKKEYPNTNELFMQWQRTDDREGKNPYADRHRCLHEKLDMDNINDRYVLGRAFYHIIQRRGFLSNRKEQVGDDSGKVKEGINSLTQEMEEAGCQYLGDYFYSLYNKGEKIRNHYTDRIEHYLAEFIAICKQQNLDDDLKDKIGKAIFDQRPLKSQKGQVGKCVFEKNKTKCPSSHPLFEEFRMLSFVNNIKIKTPKDDVMRSLNKEERESISPLFYRKSKKHFEFEDIAKKLAPKKQYGFYKKSSDVEMPYLFNYPMDTPVSGCPVTAALKDIFGENWIDAVCEVYTNANGKSRLEIINDIWHVLFFYSDSDKLALFARTKLQLGEKEAKAFSDISIPADYASLSLKAICKILPYLRKGLIYSHAVFLGNLCEVIPSYIWKVKEMREAAIDSVIKEMDTYDSRDKRTFELCIKEYLKEQYHLTDEIVEKLYHPSMMEVYPKVHLNHQGIYQLQSPRIESVRNPMAMRSMFRLRKLINRLLEMGKIDEETEIHIEFARELNDANKRQAIAELVKNNFAENEKARKAIKELYKEETGAEVEPTDVDILKYTLWKEQNSVCPYTGKNIRISDFIGANPMFDIEHTIPQSVGGDSTKMNLTLCDSRFNREIKKTKLPAELSNHDEVLQRIKGWKERYENLNQKIRKQKKLSKGATTKEQKDSIIKKRHLLELERDYWRGKYERFTMTNVPEGFSRRQGTDISVISKYARLYLKSIFKHVYTVKGIATSDFRKIWGIQEIYSKKERVNHVHHCIDAIVIACIGLDEYNKLGAYYHDEENKKWYGMSGASFPKPWSTFVEDIKNIQNELLVYHYTPDNMPKQGRRRILLDVEVNNKKKKKKVLCKGDAARGSLHKDTYYGAIMRSDEDTPFYVVRKNVDSHLTDLDIKNIVDDVVRRIIQNAVAEGGKDALNGTIWMNEEKQIPIKKVRCITSVKNPLSFEHRKPRDTSNKSYKNDYYVAPDDNYLMAVYKGVTSKGKVKYMYEFINMLDAARFYKQSNNKVLVGGNIVQLSKDGLNLDYTLKKGTMVLLYVDNPDEVWENNVDRSCRLYKVTELWKDGRIVVTKHTEARPSSEVPKVTKGFCIGDSKGLYSYSKFSALVQGYDFEINELGEIKRLK